MVHLPKPACATGLDASAVKLLVMLHLNLMRAP